jgi:hypothetical protein
VLYIHKDGKKYSVLNLQGICTGVCSIHLSRNGEAIGHLGSGLLKRSDLVIAISLETEEMISFLSVYNNGVGMLEDNNSMKHSSMGMKLIRTVGEQLEWRSDYQCCGRCSNRCMLSKGHCLSGAGNRHIYS